MKPLRVALFTDAGVFAGTERHVADLAWGMKQSGVDVCVACPPRSPLARQSAHNGIPILPIEKNGNADWQAVAVLARRLRSGELDLIHAHNGRTACLAAIAKTVAQRGRLVFTQHFLAPAHLARTGLNGGLSRWIHQRVASGCDRILAISEAVRTSIIQRDASVEEKVSVVPNGIRPPNTRRLLSPALVRARLGIGAEHFLLVCAARLEPEKDLGTLIAAMEQVARKLPRAFCAIAGEGSQYEMLRAEIPRRGLAAHVTLLGFQEDTASLLRAADLFVLPSPAEPFGLAILEAMALGKPVVASRAGGPVEIVRDTVTGLLCPPRNPAALAENILRIANSPTLAACMGAAGKSRYREAFTVERMVRSTLAAYAVR
ncbi:MAG: glycosyltransferase family 4 protein [Chthoniobacteraceae bacterium]|nr:glycosyltransferase family 4 protein [Chthoniobacteraceae bacterium]